MNRASKSALPIVVLVVLLVLFVPWSASANFGSGAMLAIAISLIGYILTRVGLKLFANKSGLTHQDVNVPESRLMREVAGGLWRTFRIGAAVALAVEAGGIAFGKSGLINPVGAFFMTLVAQQLVFVVFELFIALRLSPNNWFGARAATVASMTALAFFCALANNINLFVETPRVLPPFSITVNILFAIPALLAGVVGLLYRHHVERR
jgi:hypothetical protein